ncbi:alkaline-phosphatase-like protein [Leptodontidium sp. 2 PMI_412]|nr:alkaline-phosphatase-like protein [Leptodontidium sp. 2 PMI_412]
MAAFASVLLCLTMFACRLAVAKRPNILFILTDDQDVHMQSLENMPLVQQYLVSEGTTFSRHYCSVALCCPARATIWTGRASHNTNVTNVIPPYEFRIQHILLGKLWNAMSTANYNAPLANGFNGSDFLLDPYTYIYFNASMTRNGEAPVNYEN